MIGILVRRPEKTENKVVQQTDSAAPRLPDRQIELKPSGPATSRGANGSTVLMVSPLREPATGAIDCRDAL